MPPSSHSSPLPAILQEGDTCWRKVRAERASFIIDANTYFAAAKEAILRAERCVYLIGWEFDLDIRLRPDQQDPEVPDQLRPFLNHAVKTRPDLEIFILQWDGALLFNIARQLGSYLLLKAQAKPQIHFRLDGEHPIGACHHQKIVVIDDALAFCGGIDMTSGRWDTPRHQPRDKRREEDGEDPVPWHDMTLAVEGEVAKVLGELARWRWKNATGRDLPVPHRRESIWPEDLAPDCRDVTIGIARTHPAYDAETEVREIERLWIKAIGSARERIYIENQFLSSDSIADALKAKLQEEDGPEIVILLPFLAESWLESQAMDTQRSLIITELRQADRNGRLGVYYPVNADGDHIYVHAKLLLVDDRFVRIGSSNMSSRSMSFDTECDLAMEAADQPSLTQTIVKLRNRLLAEHLGTSVQTIEAETECCGGSVLAMIEHLRHQPGTTLQVLEPRELNESEIALARSRLMDPEDPLKPSIRIADFARRFIRRNRVPMAAAATALAAGLLFGRYRGRSRKAPAALGHQKP